MIGIQSGRNLVGLSPELVGSVLTPGSVKTEL